MAAGCTYGYWPMTSPTSLGGRAHLTALRRVRNGSLRVESARPIERLVDLRETGRLHEAMVSAGGGLSHLARVEVEGELIKAVRNGRRVTAGTGGAGEAEGPVRMMVGRHLLAVYRVEGDELVPEVVLA